MEKLVELYTVKDLHEAIKYATANDDLEINISTQDLINLKIDISDAIQDTIGSFIEQFVEGNDSAQ